MSSQLWCDVVNRGSAELVTVNKDSGGNYLSGEFWLIPQKIQHTSAFLNVHFTQIAQVFLTHAPGARLCHGYVGRESWTPHVFSFQTDEVINLFIITLVFIPMSRKFKICAQEAVHCPLCNIHYDPDSECEARLLLGRF